MYEDEHDNYGIWVQWVVGRRLALSLSDSGGAIQRSVPDFPGEDGRCWIDMIDRYHMLKGEATSTYLNVNSIVDIRWKLRQSFPFLLSVTSL